MKKRRKYKLTFLRYQEIVKEGFYGSYQDAMTAARKWLRKDGKAHAVWRTYIGG